MRLLRLQADPERVRVSVRHVPLYSLPWVALVRQADGGGLIYIGRSASPTSAVTLALHKASEGGLPGLNLDLEEVYDHPQGGGPSTEEVQAENELLKSQLASVVKAGQETVNRLQEIYERVGFSSADYEWFTDDLRAQLSKVRFTLDEPHSDEPSWLSLEGTKC